MHTLHKYRFVSGFRLESLLPWPVLVFFQISNYLRLFIMAFGCPRALVMTELKPTEYFLCSLFCQLFVFFVVVLLNVWAACSYTVVVIVSGSICHLLHSGCYTGQQGIMGKLEDGVGSKLLHWVHCKLLRFTATFGWYGRAGGERMRILYSASVDALQGSEAHPLSRPSFKHFAGYTGCFCFGIYLLFCFV